MQSTEKKITRLFLCRISNMHLLTIEFLRKRLDLKDKCDKIIHWQQWKRKRGVLMKRNKDVAAFLRNFSRCNKIFSWFNFHKNISRWYTSILVKNMDASLKLVSKLLCVEFCGFFCLQWNCRSGEAILFHVYNFAGFFSVTLETTRNNTVSLKGALFKS